MTIENHYHWFPCSLLSVQKPIWGVDHLIFAFLLVLCEDVEQSDWARFFLDRAQDANPKCS